MDLGAFSISLAVEDHEASRQFYAKLGFVSFAGEPEQNWLIVKNGSHVIGLFQGMFEKNTTGPASFMAVDPDGNVVLFDQHV